MAYTPSATVKKREEDYYAHLKNKPGEFTSDNTAKANQALDNYINRGDFKYNPATDTGYQAARKQYVRGGQQAMKDTLGTATELTGGYDNSYAQAAAQQTYNNYMAELANLMPQYEQQAYGRWQEQGNQMLNYYDIYKNAEAQDYARHQDKLNRYYADADRLKADYDTEYSNEYNNYWAGVNQANIDREYNRNAYESDRAYERAVYEYDNPTYTGAVDVGNEGLTAEDMNRNYERLEKLITKGGYKPRDDELEAAGMTRAQALGYLSEYTGVPYSGYDTVLDEAQFFIDSGASESEIKKYIAEQYDNGVITEDERNQLEKMLFSPWARLGVKTREILNQ